VKKKLLINAIFAEESDSTAVDSVIFWDGKQYKYQPIGVSGADN
jgi:phage-related protein